MNESVSTGIWINTRLRQRARLIGKATHHFLLREEAEHVVLDVLEAVQLFDRFPVSHR